jgi:hypothetical protein
MTVDALLAIIVGVAIPFLLAVGGGVLAVRALPNAKSIERWIWICSFIILLLIGVGFAFVQQIRFTTQQADAARDVQLREKALDGQNKYTQGELDSIHTVLSDVVRANAGGGNPKEFIQALVAATASAANKANGPVGLKGLSNAELRDRVFEMTQKIDSIEQQYEQESMTTHFGGNSPEAMERGYLLAHTHEERQFEQIRVEAQLLYEELLARLPEDVTIIPIRPTIANDDAMVTRSVLEHDSLAGTYPLRSVSAYMKKLALLLPQGSQKSPHGK